MCSTDAAMLHCRFRCRQPGRQPEVLSHRDAHLQGVRRQQRLERRSASMQARRARHNMVEQELRASYPSFTAGVGDTAFDGQQRGCMNVERAQACRPCPGIGWSAAPFKP